MRTPPNAQIDPPDQRLRARVVSDVGTNLDALVQSANAAQTAAASGLRDHVRTQAHALRAVATARPFDPDAALSLAYEVRELAGSVDRPTASQASGVLTEYLEGAGSDVDPNVVAVIANAVFALSVAAPPADAAAETLRALRKAVGGALAS